MAYAVLAVRFTATALRPGVGGQRVGPLLHLLMCADMAIMAAAGPLPDPLGLQAAAFLLASGWWLLRALPVRPATGHDRMGCVQHGFGAAVAVWMTFPHSHLDHPHGSASGIVPVLCVGLVISAGWWLREACWLRSCGTDRPAPNLSTAMKRAVSGPAAGAVAHAAMSVGMAVMLL
ncbi:MAG: DUF5134 domain-containing protein [Hamadaea sp.]|uniref:DUF5134 domain-containing protein n=1 Tax=Hamadaea sp. TaxID=2024425 RepID=UPI00184AEFD4|nr:DUF5134 domain-containing protein [Hamadaea sp.]NUR74453.1 DUF5134 domain-containing protein [Hamadaea sp.]NUT18961.1 DUF5134 domain-containing protein [Hamadaea sp.]